MQFSSSTIDDIIKLKLVIRIDSSFLMVARAYSNLLLSVHTYGSVVLFMRKVNKLKKILPQIQAPTLKAVNATYREIHI